MKASLAQISKWMTAPEERWNVEGLGQTSALYDKRFELMCKSDCGLTVAIADMHPAPYRYSTSQGIDVALLSSSSPRKAKPHIVV